MGPSRGSSIGDDLGKIQLLQDIILGRREIPLGINTAQHQSQ